MCLWLWGEGDVHGEAAGWQGSRGDDGGVGRGDGPDDGQAEAVAALAAGGARAETLEGEEQAVDFGGRNDLPGVGHREDSVTAAGFGGHLDVPAADVVPDGVADQVGHQLPDQERVAVEDAGLEVGADPQAETADRGVGGGQGFNGDGGQVEGFARAGTTLAAGQGKQRLDELLLLGVGREQVPADRLPRAGSGVRVSEGDLQQGALSGQGGAQLVGSVGGETPLGVEGCLKPREKAVEGIREFLELVVGAIEG